MKTAIIYDIELLLYISRYIKNDAALSKIKDIANFILSPEYQKIHGDYGWHWDFIKKTYHGTTCGLGLPLYNSDTLERDEWGFLSVLELALQLNILHNSDWFSKCVNYLEQFKTERGTYIFTDGMMYHLTYHTVSLGTLYDAFISKEALSAVKRNQRKAFFYELYGTFFMLMIKKRMETLNPKTD